MIFLENDRTVVHENVCTTVRANKLKNHLRIFWLKTAILLELQGSKNFMILI